MDNILETYILSHIAPEPEELHALYRRTHLQRLYPRMCSGHLQGRLLKMLTQMIAPQNVLELGTFTGYSALSIAEGMPRGGHLTTIEIDDEYEEELRTLFATTPRPATIELLIGDALAIIPALDTMWDMVYIDANKRHYTQYFELIADRVRPGGFIIADNTLWDGKPALEPDSRDPQTRGIADFNDRVVADPRFETVIIPLRDGLTLMRRLPADAETN